MRSFFNDFITGLQFLTTIKLAKQTNWSPEGFGKSVKFFPLIGAIVGAHLVIFHKIIFEYLPLFNIELPLHVTSALLIVISIILSGGLTCDGFMDTFDGVFSGRERTRILEIMKDSRVGANGVMSFVVLILLKYSLLLDIAPEKLSIALFVMPMLGKFAMGIGVTCFPYARKDGIGKAFAQYAGVNTLYIIIALTALFILPLGKMAIIACLVSILFTIVFAGFVKGRIGGLTGDVYGAISELTEVLVLSVFLY